MYNYPHYKEGDKKKVIEFMKDHPFITLIGADKNGRIEASQIPVLIEEKEESIFICGHIAKKSDHHKAIEENPNVLALFTGAHTYVKRDMVYRQSSAGFYLELCITCMQEDK